MVVAQSRGKRFNNPTATLERHQRYLVVTAWVGHNWYRLATVVVGLVTIVVMTMVH